MASALSIFSRARVIVAAVLFITLAVFLSLAWTTRDAMSHLPFLNGKNTVSENRNALVDLHCWKTAQALASLAVTAEERELAREAERLADHDTQQAFASALRQASAPHNPKTPEARVLAKRVDELQALVKADQQRVTDLSKSDKAAPPGSVDDDLDVAKAQLGLDSDELTDAEQDLARAEGDKRIQIKQELAAHEAMMRKYDAQTGQQTQLALAAVHQYGSVARRIKAWLDQRSRYDLLLEAKKQADLDTTTLIGQHNQLEKQTAPITGNDKPSRLASLQGKIARSQLLSVFDDRIQTQQQLAAVYDKWAKQVVLQHRIVLHLLLQSFALIAFILLCLILIDSVVRRLVERPGLDRRRMHTLRLISKVSFQVVGCTSILLVIFGFPNQTPAILGLTTAGLTVVLQDFIVAFFGWFVLMGKNGMRVGDWVEIDGVGGEVIEIGLFRTALLETGNWTDKGHPTGRRVTFINSFAIKGQYFNFSTTGQWLWDEITVSITSADDTYLMVENIHKAVLKETEEEARMAQEEWKRVTLPTGVSQFTATPAVDMRPSSTGIDIVVRYVTRACDRFEVRNRLYQRVIELMHKPPASSPARLN